MLFAYRHDAGRLHQLSPQDDITPALWVDLYRPLDAQVAKTGALGVDVPTLADMEEIEISNRLYREGSVDYMTVVLPGLSVNQQAMAGPVTFILTPARLVTVRHHAPRPFVTYPERAEKSSAGCGTPERLFLGLVEEIVARLADLLEAVGKALDGAASTVFGGDAVKKPDLLRKLLEQIGREGEALARVRLGLLTLDRMLSYYSVTAAERPEGPALRALIKAESRDIQALEVHADFLSSRVSLATEATLGMINLAQNDTVRIVSVVAALFLPPTLIASAYGMNFSHMPELAWRWGYPLAVGAMVASALITYFYFKWRHWL